jgi:hypothetical protein
VGGSRMRNSVAARKIFDMTFHKISLILNFQSVTW